MRHKVTMAGTLLSLSAHLIWAQLASAQPPPSPVIPRAVLEQAAADLTLHACIPTVVSKDTRPTTGQYFVIRPGQIVRYGSCQLGGEPWVWVERIATDYGVPVTQRGTPGSGFIVNAVQSVTTGHPQPTPVAQADFEKLARDAAGRLGGGGSGEGPLMRVPASFTFVYPPGVFTDEAAMLARGAGQAVACPGGSMSLTIPSTGPTCTPAAEVARAHPIRSLAALLGGRQQ